MHGASSTGTTMAAVFACLADDSRRHVLDVLVRDGRASASAIAREVQISRQAVAKHLSLLAEAGLVTSERAGREVLYTVRPDPLQEAAQWLDRAAVAWDRRLAALKAAAEGREGDQTATR
ncbi:MAG TPA: metalloregulator ArsR/SmtB family transcription factor [Intrasporangium sp.]|nr:metalloregulator ArsR/SmtB family transcription factor [Intrasporangium sp.]